MGTQIFQSLWIGGRLSVMERLSIQSFLDHGYAFHLYAYQAVENVPAGTVVLPGDQILPADSIFCFAKVTAKGVSQRFQIYSATNFFSIAAVGGRTLIASA